MRRDCPLPLHVYRRSPSQLIATLQIHPHPQDAGLIGRVEITTDVKNCDAVVTAKKTRTDKSNKLGQVCVYVGGERGREDEDRQA